MTVSPDVRSARTGGTGWPAVVLVGFAFFATMLGTTLPTPLYPTYALEFDFGDLVTTLVFAAYAVGVTIGLVLFGHWSDQVGRRPMLLFGLAFSALSAIVFVLPGELAWLFAGRVLSGLSAGIFIGTGTATIIDLAPAAGRERASLAAAAVNMGGLGSGPLLAGVLVQYAPHPTRLCYLVDLVLVVLGAGAVLYIGDPVRRREAMQLRPRALRVPADMRAVFTRAAIAGFAGFAVLGLFTAVSPAFLGEVLNRHNAALVGVVVLVLFAASIAGQVLATVVGLSRALPIGCGGLIAGMIVIGVALGEHSLLLLVIGALIAGLGQGMSFRAGLGSVVSASPQAQRGQITSTYFVALYVGISVPVIGVGALATATDLVTAGVVFSALVAVLAATALALLRLGPADSA